MSDWTNFYLDLAKLFAQQSKDPRLKVACVIVTPLGVVYPGINGTEIGGANEPDSLEPGQSGFVHAEMNALTRLDTATAKNSKMYLTNSPCVVCARLIVNCKAIDEVYYIEEYRDTRGIKILENSGIKCVKYEVK